MKKLIFGTTISVLIMIFFSVGTTLFAQNTNIEIIPALNQNEKEDIGTKHNIISNTTGNNNTGTARDRYNQIATGLSVEEQIVSGIMTRDTLLNYLVKVLSFISQLGILMGGVMMIVVGYQYIMSVISGGSEPQKDYIKNAIIGILVIIFSYAIMRILTRTFFM